MEMYYFARLPRMVNIRHAATIKSPFPRPALLPSPHDSAVFTSHIHRGQMAKTRYMSEKTFPSASKQPYRQSFAQKHFLRANAKATHFLPPIPRQRSVSALQYCENHLRKSRKSARFADALPSYWDARHMWRCLRAPRDGGKAYGMGRIPPRHPPSVVYNPLLVLSNGS